MQITAKLRDEIAMSLPNLGWEEVLQIAKESDVSTDTVYRYWRRIHGRATGKIPTHNNVVIALAELAAKRAAEARAKDERLKKSMEQLSA